MAVTEGDIERKGLPGRRKTALTDDVRRLIDYRWF